MISSDASGNKRQTQLVLNHTHSVQHTLNTSWITVNKQQIKQFCKLMVNRAGVIIIASQCKTHHAVKCAKCGKTAYQPHAFAQKEGCRRHCPGCGYEEAHHEFAGGRCRDCGIDESDYYADLIASGEVGYYDNESKSGQWFVNYGDHVTTIPALTRLFIALADNDGADNYAPESIARKLNEIASEQPEKADSVSASFAQIACDEGVHIYWRSWVMEQDLTGDPALLEEARESVRRWREEHPHSQADIDYENAMIASDSGLYTTG